MPDGSPNLGALFDWDGVVIDSHDQHEESWKLLAREEGADLPEGFFEATFGMRNEQIIPGHLAWPGTDDPDRVAALGDRKEELYREIIRRDGIAPLPGVIDLLEMLKAAGIPCAVGSSTPRENIDTIMSVIGVADMFQAVVAAADVTAGKPAPDVFLTGAQRIGRAPDRCLVFEDAFVGIEAGKRAGCKVIAVATTNALDSLQASADLAVESLADLNLDSLTSLFE